MKTHWQHVDGEYNEQIANIDGQNVTIYSDRDGESWCMRVDDGEDEPLEAVTEIEARLEAEEIADEI